MDWNLGSYERIAAQLAPATRAVLAAAAPRPGERLLDVGCGSGNASLAGAELGTVVTGVDPAPRLLRAAASALADRGFEGEFLEGTAEALPVADASAEVLVSVFGVIFATDAPAAIAEMARVTSEQGTIVIAAWLPEGAVFELARLRRRAMRSDEQALAAPPPFAWHDAQALGAACSPYGLAVEQRGEELAFTASSPQAFLEDELRDHPLWVAASERLEETVFERAKAEALEILTEANEEPGGFCVTSNYKVSRLIRP
jgi:ubiquinone/menaquinone biosynthesis C-methylase UbiE